MLDPLVRGSVLTVECCKDQCYKWLLVRETNLGPWFPGRDTDMYGIVCLGNIDLAPSLPPVPSWNKKGTQRFWNPWETFRHFRYWNSLFSLQWLKLYEQELGHTSSRKSFPTVDTRKTFDKFPGKGHLSIRYPDNPSMYRCRNWLENLLGLLILQNSANSQICSSWKVKWKYN